MLTSALEKLGSDRVMRGHVALEHGTRGDWNNCFLAMCFGGYGRLNALLRTPHKEGDEAAVMLGLSNAEVWAVTEAFDHCRAEMQALVEEWLELNHVAAVPA